MNNKRSLGDRLREASWTPMSDESRAAHLDAIDTAVTEGRRTLVARPVRRRRLTVAVVAASLFILPTGIAFAAEGSLPGEALFPIKKITETVRSWVDDDVVAQHRVDELAELLSRDAPQAAIVDQLDKARIEVDQLATDHVLQPVLDDLSAAVSALPPDDDAVAHDRDRDDVPVTTTTTVSDVPITTVQPTDHTTTTTTPPTDSTVPPDADRVRVVGWVTAGPTCPVAQFPPDPDCADRPVAGAVLLIKDLDGDELLRVESNREGRFVLRLLPGVYLLEPQPHDGLLGTAPPQEFTVKADPVELLVGYDTGIR